MAMNAPRQDRSRATLAAIVQAAETLLDERPFQDVSVADIIARAGCTTGSFYARFASKDALIPYLYEKYDEALYQKPRWLVFNKTDLLPGATAAEASARKIVRALRWKAPWFMISAINGKGCRELSGRVYQFISTPAEKKKGRRAA